MAISHRALCLVDCQPTFCEGGELPTNGANAVVERIAEYVEKAADRYDIVATTQDWHIDPGDHFSDNPDFVDTWPPHGIAQTDNAKIHPALDDVRADIAVKKGQYAAAYSGFEGTTEDGSSLAQALKAHNITDIDIVGLVLSHCVKETALDAKRYGFTTRVLTDLTVPVSPELGERAIKQLDEAGITLTQSHM